MTLSQMADNARELEAEAMRYCATAQAALDDGGRAWASTVMASRIATLSTIVWLRALVTLLKGMR